MYLKNKILISTILVASVFVFTSSANASTFPPLTSLPSTARTFYVATSGADSNSGLSSSSAFRTIRKGISVGGPGVTLRIGPGTYTESFPSNIPSGRDLGANAFVMTADDPNNMPIINGGGEDVMHFAGNQSYIIIDHIIIDGASTNPARQAIKVTESGPNAAHHIRFSNCVIRNARGQGIILSNGATENEILYCKVHNNGNAHGIHGIYWASGRGKIIGNDVHNNSDYGGQLAYDGTIDLLVEGNRWHDNGGGGFNNYAMPRNMTVINNLTYRNGGPGMDLYGALNLKVYNNTSWGNGGAGISYDSGLEYDASRTVSVDIRNNIASSLGIIDGRNMTQGNNLFGGDPKFVNAAANDFRLTVGSPAINAGATLGIVTKDFTGASRPVGGAYDIGAYEYGGTGGGATPTPTPTPTATVTPTPSPTGGLKGDLNNDRIVNSLDWSMMNARWFTSDSLADLNSDGIVNSLDFSIMNGNWLKSG